MNKTKFDSVILPFIGIAVVLLIWEVSSLTWSKELPSPIKTWQASQLYIAQPFAKRGELDQGILRFTWLSLILVAKVMRSRCWSYSTRFLPRSIEDVYQGVRSIPQDYLNVARVLKLSRLKTLFRVLIPATLPYMFTGFRLSLELAWLVILAAEFLTGRPGIGGFLWQEYNALSYEHIILSIIAIGVVGFVLDRLMSVIESRFKTS